MNTSKDFWDSWSALSNYNYGVTSTILSPGSSAIIDYNPTSSDLTNSYTYCSAKDIMQMPFAIIGSGDTSDLFTLVNTSMGDELREVAVTRNFDPIQATVQKQRARFAGMLVMDGEVITVPCSEFDPYSDKLFSGVRLGDQVALHNYGQTPMIVHHLDETAYALQGEQAYQDVDYQKLRSKAENLLGNELLWSADNNELQQALTEIMLDKFTQL